MSFKGTKTYKELLKIIKINIILGIIFSLSCCPNMFIYIRNASFWKIVFSLFLGFIMAIIFFLPVSFVFFISAAIDEFIQKDSKTLKAIIKILAAHIFPAIVLTLGTHCEIIKYKSTVCNLLNEFGIILWIYLLFSIPISAIYLIRAIINDLGKKFIKHSDDVSKTK